MLSQQGWGHLWPPMFGCWCRKALSKCSRAEWRGLAPGPPDLRAEEAPAGPGGGLHCIGRRLASCTLSMDDHHQLLKGRALSCTFKNSPGCLSPRLAHKRGTESFVTQCQKLHPKAQGTENICPVGHLGPGRPKPTSSFRSVRAAAPRPEEASALLASLALQPERLSGSPQCVCKAACRGRDMPGGHR